MGFSQKHLRVGLMFLVSLFFFLGSLVLVNSRQMYVSPDETANAFFAERLAKTGQLSGAYDPLAENLDNRLHPRSMVSVDGQLLPGSFLGLPLFYGLLNAALGSWVLWVLTPLMALGAAYAWWRMMQRLVSKRVAALSTFLFLFHPALWYYSARGLMHNVLFVSLLVIGLWLIVSRPIKNKRKMHWFNDPLGGLLIGFSLMVRTSELWWMLIVSACIGVFCIRHLSLRRAQQIGLGLLVAFALMLGMNAYVYGGPLITGYTVGLEQPQALDVDLTSGDSVEGIQVFPFGIHPRSAWMHFNAYGIGLFWWLSLPMIPGLVVFLARKKRRFARMGFVLAFGIISIWLILMYGSWEIYDNPDPSQITMANSYVRYWLPIYLMSMVFVASLIDWVIERAKTPVAKAVFGTTLVLLVIGLNMRITFVHGPDNLLSVRQTLLVSNEIQASVLEKTEEDAVIIVDRGDKLFFPHRRVLYPLRDDVTYATMPEIVNEVALYYYGITFPKDDLQYLNNSRLKRMNLQIRLVDTYEEESLYEIYPMNQN